MSDPVAPSILKGVHRGGGVTGFLCERDVDDPLAKELLAALHHAYPQHSWFIEIRGGVVIIRHFGIGRRPWCMANRLANIQHDWAVAKKKVVQLAGEYLERANLPRGAYEGQIVTTVDGIPRGKL